MCVCSIFVHLLVLQRSVGMQSLWSSQMEGDNLEGEIGGAVAGVFMKRCADDGGERERSVEIKMKRAEGGEDR